LSNSIRISIGLAILVALVFLAFSLLTVRIPPATIGVKQALWGSGGYDQQDYGTGLAWAVAGVQRWHFLPTLNLRSWNSSNRSYRAWKSKRG
jgi:hypothetical protein